MSGTAEGSATEVKGAADKRCMPGPNTVRSNETNMPENKPVSILIVDDDPAMVLTLRKALSGMGHIRFALNGVDALRLISQAVPDIVLLDAEMPGMSGFEVCEAIHADPNLAELPVIFVTSHTDADFEESGFAAGAVDFIGKPIKPRTVQARVKTHLRLKAVTELLRAQATTDGLTQLRNRRAFDEALRVEWARALRTQEPLALLMIDVDHFKRFNDHYGHAAGDDCLRHVATVLQGTLARASDFAARYGGEEFALLLPGTDMAGAQRVAENVRAALKKAQLPHARSPVAEHVTVSIGISVLDKDCEAWHLSAVDSRYATFNSVLPKDLVHAADLALYAAKGAGRDRHALLSLDKAYTPLPV